MYANDNNPMPFESMSYSNPAATHQVTCASRRFGQGIYGYYTEFQAKAVQRWLQTNGCRSTINPHDRNERFSGGIHPLVAAALNGYVES